MAAPIKNSYRVLEFYSGIGGMHYALKESGIWHKVLAAYDVNAVANRIYQHNFPDTRVIDRSIEVLSREQLEADIVLMSPPCQPYTRVGKQQDLNDVRARSFLHILGLLPRLETCPSYMLVENVKGFETSESRNKLVDTLQQCNYSYQELLLTPLQFGIPNSRLRYFLIAKRKPLTFAFETSSEVMQTLPECCTKWLTFRMKAESQKPSCNCGGYRGNKNNYGETERLDKSLSRPLTPECDVTKQTTTTTNSDNNTCTELSFAYSINEASQTDRKHKISHDEEIAHSPTEHSNCKRQKAGESETNLTDTEITLSTLKSSSEIESLHTCIATNVNNMPMNSTVNEYCLEKYGHNMRQSSRESDRHGPCLKLGDFLESDSMDCQKFVSHLIPDKLLNRFVIMDVVNPCSQKSTCFTKRYGRYVEGAGSVVQMSGDVDRLNAASDLKEHAVEKKNRDQWGDTEYDIIRQLKLRFFTPREVANIMCFPKTFGFPDDITTRQRYMVLGNSLNVHIVAVLIKLMTCEP